MSGFILSERAKKDLRQIWHYTVDSWSVDQAKKYYDELLDICEMIPERTVRGIKTFEGIRPGLLGYHCNHHIIFFKSISKNRIRIIRILHDKMDFPRHL